MTKNIIKIQTENSFCDVEINLKGMLKDVSKDTAIIKINRLIEDLKEISELLEKNKNIDYKNNSFGGLNGYSWDYVANK